MVKRFMWHHYQHFQWSCLIHVLSRLKTRTHGPEAEHAWRQIERAYDHRPDVALGKRVRLPLYVAVNRVALEAWSCREAAVAARAEEAPLEVPDFIKTLRELQTRTATPNSKAAGPGATEVLLSQAPLQADPTPAPYAYGDTGGEPLVMPPQDAALLGYPDLYSTPSMLNEPVDWRMFDSLISGEMQGFGDATLSGAAFQSNLWETNGHVQ